MSTIYVDFAVCPCGEQTALRPAKPESSNSRLQPSETDEGSVLIACLRCKRVYNFDTSYLVSKPSPWGIGPYNPDAPMSVFPIPIECDWVGCKAHLVVHVVLKSDTSNAELESRKQDLLNWTFLDATCPDGHEYPRILKIQG